MMRLGFVAILVICSAVDVVSAQETRPRVVVGQVLDADGNAVADAQIWLPIVHGQEDRIARAVSQSNGEFRIEFPDEWLDPVVAKNLWDVWAFKDGFSMGAASASMPLFSGMSNIPVEITLSELADTAFTVRDPDQNAISGATIRPLNFRTPTAYALVPDELADLVAATTDENGRAMMPYVPRNGLFTVNVFSDRFGIQQQRLDTSDEADPETIVNLRPVGSIVGRVTADNPEFVRDVRLYVTTTSQSDDIMSTTGIADVRTNERGEFVVEAIAEGEIQFEEQIDSSLPVRLRLPESIRLSAAEELSQQIEMESAVLVTGTIRVAGSNDPVEGALISIRYGSYRQGERAVSDENGQFTAQVLPGSVYQQVISIPRGVDAVQLGTPWRERLEIADGVERFELPAIELVPVVEIPGQLIDENDRPIADARINVVSNGRRYGTCRSDDEGNFRLRVPRGLAIESYQVSSGELSSTPEVVDNSPLVLRLRID